jgi:hypothetical protein
MKAKGLSTRIADRCGSLAEYCGRIENAFLREKQVRLGGRAKRLALLRGELERLKPLSKKQSRPLRD